jgi:hypothetical protein
MHHDDPNVATLSLDVTALSVDGSTEPPTEFRIFTAGKVDTWKGSFQFDDRAAEDVMAPDRASKRRVVGRGCPMDAGR